MLIWNAELQMQQLGFQGYALDFVECPEGLKWFLQRDLQLHRTVSLLTLSSSFYGHLTISANAGHRP